MDNKTEVRADSLTNRLLDEGLVPVTKAASDLGISISSKTALRWCLNGARGARLESLRVGGRRMTSRAAMRRFIAAMQDQPPQPVRPASCLDRAAADKILAAFGLGRAASD